MTEHIAKNGHAEQHQATSASVLTDIIMLRQVNESSIVGNKDVSALKGIMQNLCTSPHMLRSMPDLSDRGLQEDTTHQQERDDFARAIGFNSFNDLEQEGYSLAVIDEVFDMNGTDNFAHNLGLGNPTDATVPITHDPYNKKPTIPLRYLLESAKFELDKIDYSERKIRGVKAKIQQFIDQGLLSANFAPTEDTELHLIFRYDTAGIAQYVGKKGGDKHIMELRHSPVQALSIGEWKSVFREGFPIAEDVQDTILLIHELMHQRHAELVGHESYSNVGSLNNMRGIVVEGFATYVEHLVLESWLDDARKDHEDQTEPILRALETYREQLRKNDKLPEEQPRAWPGIIQKRYRIGLRLMQSLVNQYGRDELPTLIEKIDLKACEDIDEESTGIQKQKWQQIIGDYANPAYDETNTSFTAGNPNLLPGVAA
jgi:hypothetical protein